MPWTFDTIPAFRERQETYESELDRRLLDLAGKSARESTAQEVLQEDRDYKSFLRAREKYEVSKSNPMRLPVACGAGFTARLDEFRKFTHDRFKVIYHCKAEEAVAVYFYRVTKPSELLHDFVNRLKSLTACGESLDTSA